MGGGVLFFTGELQNPNPITCIKYYGHYSQCYGSITLEIVGGLLAMITGFVAVIVTIAACAKRWEE